MERSIEEVVIGGQKITLVHDDIQLEKALLDETNPRIRYRLKHEADGKKLDEVILAMPEVKALRRDILQNRGLRERIIVQENGDGSFKVREGNCRTVCYRWLRQKYPTDATWKKIPARILPRDVDQRSVAILLSDFHVAGKIRWDAHEKAGQIYYMVNELGMPTEEVATYLRSGKATILRYLQAYQFMVERFLKIDDEKYAAAGEHKWSYFDELFKKKELRTELKTNPQFGDQFCRWVGEAKLQPVEVRELYSVLNNPEARKKLEKSGTFAEAKEVLKAQDPEYASDFFKLLRTVREACTQSAQIGEVERTRTDKAAQRKMIETHNALVGFMRLAGLEPPKA